MADRYTGVPDVEPELQAPDDLQHEQASPASFGGAAAQGAEALGQGAFKAADFYGQVAADQATNNFLDTRDKLLYGDPSKTGADGTPDTGFLGLRGADAMRAAPEVQEQLDEALKEQQSGLETPMARQQFETQSRRYRAQTLEQIGQHADQQQKIWATDTNKTAIQIGLNQVAAVAGDDAASAAAGERVLQAYKKNAQLAGEDPDGAVLAGHQHIALTRINALVGSNDPAQRAAAEKVLDANSDVLASLPNYDQIVSKVRGAVVEATLDPTVDSLVTGALSGAQTGTSSAAPFSTVGPGYDKVRAAAQKAGATSDEIDLALKVAHAESSGNPDAMNGSHSGVFQYGPNGPRTPEDQTAQFITDSRANKATLTRDLGRAPTEAELYLMHQQGPGGGPAILTAPADMSAVAALTPAYHGNAATATAAIAGNIGMPYKTPEQKAAANTAAANMTAGQFRDFWTGRIGGASAAGGTDTSGMSTADRLVTQMPELEANARATLEKQFPNQPDVVDRGVGQFDRQLNLQISRQREQYTVDTHVVQAAMEGGKPINEQELISSSPQVAAAWQRMQVENPLQAAGVQRMFDANSHGAAVVYGTQFKSNLDRALAPSADPNHISTPAQLYPYVGAGPDAALTNSGVQQISALTALRGTPQGEAQLAQMKTFVDQMHGQLSASNAPAGYYDEKGEAAYSKFIGYALPVLQKAAKSGTLSQVLDPANPDYVGKSALPFLRSQAQMMHDRITYKPPTGAYTPDALRQDLDSLDNDQQRADALKAAVRDHRLTASVYAAYLAARQGAGIGAAGAQFHAPTPTPLSGGAQLTDAQARAKLKAEGLNEPGL